MRQALQEAREYRDTTEGGPGSGPQKGGKKFSSSEIKKAYGILNDPRYKQGNYTGAAKAINKLAPGLADHPDVKNAMKRANENLDLPATGDTTTSNASQEVEQVDEAKFTPAQVSALKDKYGKLGPGAEKNAVQMDKLAKMMSKYSKSHLSQLADMGVPMVSKVAKELMKEETLVEQWKFEMDIETNDDGDMILVHGNVSASSESQAQQKFDKLEKEMEKKYGQGSVEGGVFKGKNTHTSGRGPVTRKNI